MANLESLVSKIKEDAVAKSSKIIEEAKAQEAMQIEKSKAKAEADGKVFIDKALRESQLVKERILSNARLQVRDERLKARQRAMDIVFNKALESLKNMDLDDFLHYVKNNILSSDIQGDERILFNHKYYTQISFSFVDEVNANLKSLGKKGAIAISDKAEDIKDGFVLLKDGVQMNFTFEALIESFREELSDDIYALLFHEE